MRRTLDEEERTHVRVDHDAHIDQNLVTQVCHVKFVRNVFNELEEELPLVGLLEAVFVVDGAGGILGHVNSGLQQRAQDVSGGRW